MSEAFFVIPVGWVMGKGDLLLLKMLSPFGGKLLTT
jgi:hypothetical protein